MEDCIREELSYLLESIKSHHENPFDILVRKNFTLIATVPRPSRFYLDQFLYAYKNAIIFEKNVN